MSCRSPCAVSKYRSRTPSGSATTSFARAPSRSAPPAYAGEMSLSKSSEKSILALTFDDGPSEWTPSILDLLAEHDARATFFILGAGIAGAEP
jgi:peptidoglycan/xylan/chitin deacetylase (PgdA/CDA1 family)